MVTDGTSALKEPFFSSYICDSRIRKHLSLFFPAFVVPRLPVACAVSDVTFCTCSQAPLPFIGMDGIFSQRKSLKCQSSPRTSTRGDGWHFRLLKIILVVFYWRNSGPDNWRTLCVHVFYTSPTVFISFFTLAQVDQKDASFWKLKAKLQAVHYSVLKLIVQSVNSSQSVQWNSLFHFCIFQQRNWV